MNNNQIEELAVAATDYPEVIEQEQEKKKVAKSNTKPRGFWKGLAVGAIGMGVLSYGKEVHDDWSDNFFRGHINSEAKKRNDDLANNLNSLDVKECRNSAESTIQNPLDYVLLNTRIGVHDAVNLNNSQERAIYVPGIDELLFRRLDKTQTDKERALWKCLNDKKSSGIIRRENSED